MNINYSLKDIFKILGNAFSFNIFITIIISSLIYIILLFINNKRKYTNKIFIIINAILIIIISIFYLKGIVRFNFSKPIKNIYFYFFNSIIYLIIISIFNKRIKIKYKIISYIFYFVVLINLLYSLFMTIYLNNFTELITINIYPMILIGNITCFIYYIFTITLFLTKKV